MLQQAYRHGQNDLSCNVTSIHRQLMRGKAMMVCACTHIVFP